MVKVELYDLCDEKCYLAISEDGAIFNRPSNMILDYFVNGYQLDDLIGAIKNDDVVYFYSQILHRSNMEEMEKIQLIEKSRTYYDITSEYSMEDKVVYRLKCPVEYNKTITFDEMLETREDMFRDINTGKGKHIIYNILRDGSIFKKSGNGRVTDNLNNINDNLNKCKDIITKNHGDIPVYNEINLMVLLDFCTGFVESCLKSLEEDD